MATTGCEIPRSGHIRCPSIRRRKRYPIDTERRVPCAPTGRVDWAGLRRCWPSQAWLSSPPVQARRRASTAAGTTITIGTMAGTTAGTITGGGGWNQQRLERLAVVERLRLYLAAALLARAGLLGAGLLPATGLLLLLSGAGRSEPELHNSAALTADFSRPRLDAPSHGASFL